jgi:hypothetical protein
MMMKINRHPLKNLLLLNTHPAGTKLRWQKKQEKDARLRV